ncbi:MAG TPA: hypothetical protein VKY85_12620 [Candidatus Angelobacter sp.]|nr:hypothetical protein [Candidatus Angelobacter sp.]
MDDKNTGNVAKKIEMVANVAIIIAAVAIVILFLRNYTKSQPGEHVISAGTKFALKGVDWQSNGKSVVLAISTTCHFCTESAGFYRVLVDQCKQQHVRTVAVLPQAAPEAKAYLQNEGVSVDEIRQSVLSDLEVSGTPTLLLIDKGGIVKSVWVGKLRSDEEKEVLAKLTSSS